VALDTDNTNWRAGGLEDRVSKWKTWTFGGLAGCTEDRRAGWWAAQKRRSGGLRKRARWAAEKGSPPACLFL